MADPIISADQFFSEEKAPASLEQTETALRDFIKQHSGRPVVCVTSGGTTIPLEKNTVRFIDNFSEGNRGAAAVEHFLLQGYAVVFVRRVGSVAPFARHVQAALNAKYLDHQFLSQLSISDSGLRIQPTSTQSPSSADSLSRVMAWFKQVQTNQLLLSIEFNTVIEYLFLLRSVSQAFASVGPSAMLFLAAAVSDFYIPSSSMATHKIQSRDGPLEMTLPQTPKLLKCLKSDWCPKAFCVSFKLETDQDILMRKAESAIEKYHMDAVVANELHSRKHKVVIVTEKQKVIVTTAGYQSQPTETQQFTKIDAPKVPSELFSGELDEQLVAMLVSQHAAFIADQKQAA